jgi:hypothetical protein
MDVYRVQCSNLLLTGEYRTYYVLAKDCAGAEAKALKKMASELTEHKSQNYAYEINLLGTLVR